MSAEKYNPIFVEAMKKLTKMSEEERLSDKNKELFEQAMNYAPLDIQPQLIAIRKKYDELHWFDQRGKQIKDSLKLSFIVEAKICDLYQLG